MEGGILGKGEGALKEGVVTPLRTMVRLGVLMCALIYSFILMFLNEPISRQHSISLPLKTSENQTLAYIFKGYRTGTLV